MKNKKYVMLKKFTKSIKALDFGREKKTRKADRDHGVEKYVDTFIKRIV